MLNSLHHSHRQGRDYLSQQTMLYWHRHWLLRLPPYIMWKQKFIATICVKRLSKLKMKSYLRLCCKDTQLVYNAVLNITRHWFLYEFPWDQSHHNGGCTNFVVVHNWMTMANWLIDCIAITNCKRCEKNFASAPTLLDEKKGKSYS